MKQLKLIFLAVLFAFGVLIACAFMMNNFTPSPVTAAKSHSITQGWADDELTLAGFETSAKISGSKGTVRLNGNKPDRQVTIRVELRKALFATKWRVVEYDESHVDEDPPKEETL